MRPVSGTLPFLVTLAAVSLAVRRKPKEVVVVASLGAVVGVVGPGRGLKKATEGAV